MWYQRLSVRGPSFYLKFLIKKKHNSKNIPFRVMPLALQLHLVMISKDSKLGVDTLSFNTFWVIGFLYDDNDDYQTITIAWLFLWNRQAKNKLTLQIILYILQSTNLRSYGCDFIVFLVLGYPLQLHYFNP